MIKESIAKKIDKSIIVSFDIFDTALLRNVSNPSDIFRVIDTIKGNEFYKRRIEAEIKAKSFFKKNAPNIDEIYHFMGKDDLNYEIEIEKKFLCANNEIKQIYDYCVANKKRIIFVSDMYLPSKILSDILKDNGYNLFEKVYVSCEYNKTKYDGSLFDDVIKDLKIDPKQIIHIGDSIKSDYLFPRMKNINSFLYKRHICKKEEYNSIQENFFYTFLNNSFVKDDEYYRYGFKNLGILLFSYSMWLKNDLTRKGIKKVFFLSRDGFLMKRAFDIIDANKEFDSHYLYVSRRSLNVPNLWKKTDFDSLDKSISMSNFFNIETFVKRIGLNCEKYRAKISEFGISDTMEYSLKEFKNDEKLRLFYNSLISDVTSNSKKEYKDLKSYLKQEKFFGKIAIVDIGWHGSMQKNLEKICSDMDNKVELFGYYFGQEEVLKNANGFLFNEFDQPDYKISIAGSFGFFESLFLANHGTVIKYSKVDNKVKPILDKYEFSSDDDNKRIISELQNGAIDFCKNFCKNDIFMKYDFSSFSFLPIKNTCVNPALKEIKMFKNIMFNDTKNERIIVNRSLFYYIFHLKHFISDYYKSVWKMGFLKNIFKLPLPYYKLYFYMKSRELNKKIKI